MAWVTPTNVATGDVLTAATWNQSVVANSVALPRGYVARASATTNQTGITTIADVTGLSVTFTADAARLYKTTFYVPYIEQVSAAAYPELRITDGSNVEKQRAIWYLLTNHGDSAHLVVVESGLSGSVTRKARASTNAGTLTLAAGSTYPMFIMVEDIGAV